MNGQQRKDEILAKRAKLAELKRTREQRDKERAQRESGIHGVLDSSSAGTSTPLRGAESRKELDDLINSLVPEGSGRGSRAGSPAARPSRPTSMIGSDAGPGSPGGNRTAAAPVMISISTQTSPDVNAPLSTAVGAEAAQPLAVGKKEVVSYSVGVQTSEEWMPQRPTDDANDLDRDGEDVLEGEDGVAGKRSSRSQKRMSRRDKDREEELRQNLRREIEEEFKAIKDPTSTGAALATGAVRFPARALTVEESKAVTSSDIFLDFVDRSSKVIERALDDEYDLLADYATNGVEDEDSAEEDGFVGTRGRGSRKLKEVAQFYDEKWSKRRMISDLNFSPKFPELLVAAYTKNASAPQEPSGLVQVWNCHLQSRPEYRFEGTSDILTAKFSPFHPSLILGGCYSGQVLLWDTRARSPLPVQKTPLSGAGAGGHTHPVYALDVVGTQNANNVLSCSTDGAVCGWSIDMLAQPQEYLELITPPPARVDDLGPTCMAFPPADPTSFLVGTEEGTVYPCHRYDRAGAKAGVDPRVRYKGHAAPVMSVNFHSARGPVDLGDLALTASLDWTVRLWKIRAPSTSTIAATKPSNTTSAVASVYAGGNAGAIGAPPSDGDLQEVRPALEFAREDVVYDARWAPARPGVFALVDGAGSVEVWNVLADIEIPVAKTTPSPNRRAGTTGAAGGSYGLKALNKVAWDEKDGKRLAVGGAGGLVTVFEVGSGLTGETGKAEEWTAVKRLVAKMEREGR